MAKVWLVTGVSGSGRIEMLNELKNYAISRNHKVKVIDAGRVIEQKAKENSVSFVPELIMNMDSEKLSLLRALAIQAIKQEIISDSESEVIFIGIHALFFWKGKLIPGVSYLDLLSIELNGIITVVDDVIKIAKTNANNPVWKEDILSSASLQRWMMEEELLSNIFASIKSVPMFVMAKKQRIENLYAFLFENKKRIYLSYPITAIRDDPGLLEEIQTEYKNRLEQMFFVFNPLDIMDKTHVYEERNDVEGFLAEESKDLIDARTIERDYRFISQSNAVVVIYPTEKQSQGVSAEMQYAYAHQIPVYIYFKGGISPFLSQIAKIYADKEEFFDALKEFAEET